MDSSNKSTQQQPQKQPEPGEPGGAPVPEGVKKAFEQHKATPGPALPKDFNVAEEGTKEERRARAQELNK